MLEAAIVSEFPDDAVELVLLQHGLSFFGPAVQDDDGAPFGVYQAQKTAAQSVAAAAADAAASS